MNIHWHRGNFTLDVNVPPVLVVVVLAACGLAGPAGDVLKACLKGLGGL